jgi:heme/copper-type cytochrome/quinol oxidase subunit 3
MDKARRLAHARGAVGLYWHFADIIWIFLPLLYLIGHH